MVAAYFSEIGRRLSFRVGVELVAAGHPDVGTISNLLTCSTRDSFALPASMPCCDQRPHGRVLGQRLRVRRDAAFAAYAAAASGSSVTSATL